MDRWNHARQLFAEHFTPLRTAGFELERLPDARTYWQLHEAALRADFPPEVFFNFDALSSEATHKAQTLLGELRGGAAA